MGFRTTNCKALLFCSGLVWLLKGVIFQLTLKMPMGYYGSGRHQLKQMNKFDRTDLHKMQIPNVIEVVLKLKHF